MEACSPVALYLTTLLPDHSTRKQKKTSYSAIFNVLCPRNRKPSLSPPSWLFIKTTPLLSVSNCPNCHFCRKTYSLVVLSTTVTWVRRADHENIHVFIKISTKLRSFLKYSQSTTWSSTIIGLIATSVIPKPVFAH